MIVNMDGWVSVKVVEGWNGWVSVESYILKVIG